MIRYKSINMKIKRRVIWVISVLLIMIFSGCGLSEAAEENETASIAIDETENEGEMPVIVVTSKEQTDDSDLGDVQVNSEDLLEGALSGNTDGEVQDISDEGSQESMETKTSYASGEAVSLNPEWQYASFSKINSGAAVFYSATENRRGLTVGVNAGHGTNGGGSVKTYCHPDMSPKVTGGTTAAGSIEAVAVSGGMSFKNGEKEADVNLRLAGFLRDELLRRGYDVLMIRDARDVQLDNVARTVICNNCADCHIAIHFDGDTLDSDKGCFFISVPDGIKGMEPVDRTWQMSEELGSQIVSALANHGHKLHNGGSMDIDLTQTSYSSVPSVDVEYGNQCTDTSDANLSDLASATADGVEGFFSVSN